MATKHVLYVEDHAVNAMLMQALMESRPSVHLTVATTGEEGLRAALQTRPDLLLLDLRLPDCHGTQLLQRMRAHPSLAEVPAVAVTAEQPCMVEATSFSEAWYKPLDMLHTLQRLDELLDLSQPPLAALRRGRMTPLSASG
jgi:CheY-like chemotaxis protein